MRCFSRYEKKSHASPVSIAPPRIPPALLVTTLNSPNLKVERLHFRGLKSYLSLQKFGAQLLQIQNDPKPRKPLFGPQSGGATEVTGGSVGFFRSHWIVGHIHLKPQQLNSTQLKKI